MAKRCIHHDEHSEFVSVFIDSNDYLLIYLKNLALLVRCFRPTLLYFPLILENKEERAEGGEGAETCSFSFSLS